MITGKKVRLRSCGIVLDQSQRFLLLKHEGVGPLGYIWAPAGGGVEFGESAKETLKRELKEETGLEGEVGDLLFINEYMDDRIHAEEFFFEVQSYKGEPFLGEDPERVGEKRVLTDLRFFTLAEIKDEDPRLFHNFFRLINKTEDLRNLPKLITFKQ